MDKKTLKGTWGVIRVTSVASVLGFLFVPEGWAAIQLQPYLSGLSRPVLLTSAKDGPRHVFVVEQSGRIKVVQPGATTPAVFLDVSSRITTAGNEQGLL